MDLAQSPSTRSRRSLRPMAHAVIAVLLCSLAMLPAAGAAELLAGHKMTLQDNSHALGVAGGYPGASGFVYRRYFGNSFLQFNLLPLVQDRGDWMAIMFGATFGQYLLIWQQPMTASLMPTTTALRFVVGASSFFSRDKSQNFELVATPGTVPGTTPTIDPKVENLTGLSAGIGFEFGAIKRSGFSFALDLMLTATWDDEGFSSLVPLPFGAIVYSW